VEEELLALLAPLPCHWGEAPQGTRRPFVVLRLVSEVRPVTQDGLRPGLVRSRVQADCYGETYFGGLRLARDLIGRVEGRRVGRFQGVFVDGVRDLTGKDDIGTGVAHRRAVDLLIHHNE
jgi:hypothetical protein